MDTHFDRQHASSFLDRLKERAEEAKKAQASAIAGGKDGESPLCVWNSNNVQVKHLPPDEQGILRISIGGGQTPVPLNYCVIRGDLGQCIELLERALTALRDAP